MKGNIVLVCFYSPKALGVRYLESALTQAGFSVTLVFFKNFNSTHPKMATAHELELLADVIRRKNPMAIGLSVMASYYLDAVAAVDKKLRMEFDIPTIWGGVYPTLFAEKCMERADFVIRGEGEAPFTELAEALYAGTDYTQIPNLTYRTKDGAIVTNEMRSLMTDLDEYGIPNLGGDKYSIEDDKICHCDPQLGSKSYEITGSRGCYFACSYCSTIALKRLAAKKGTYVRYRAADKMIDELVLAKKRMKKLKYIRFWDEIFCDDPEWVDYFVKRYKREIGLPFEIWGHPLRTNLDITRKLKKAGLFKVVMGIQSGSPYIRREIFNRVETQEQILEAARILSECKVPQVIYDFMLRHPFETHDTLRETLHLCEKLAKPFELQMHGLNFLPGTDIIQKALDQKLVTPEKMQELLDAPMQEQYNTHWSAVSSDATMDLIYKQIYLTQFPSLHKKAKKLGEHPDAAAIDKLHGQAQKRAKLRYYYKRALLFAKGSI